MLLWCDGGMSYHLQTSKSEIKPSLHTGPSPSFHLVGIPLDNLPFIEPRHQIQSGSSKPIPGNTEGESKGHTIEIDLLHMGRELNWIHHTFPDDVEPVRFEVNGSKGRRAICVLYNDGLRYSVFDMDSRHDAEEDEDGDKEEEGPESEG